MYSKVLARLKINMRGWSIYFYVLLISLFFLYFTNTPYINLLNNLLVDKLHGQIEPRNDVVIITIDDQSLAEIGAWPWSRDIFAQSINNLSKYQPGVVAFDVLFLEERERDELVREAINSASMPIVLGNKITDNTLVTTIYDSTTALEGFVNYTSDSDGIIRKVFFTRDLAGGCADSFVLKILKAYYQEETPSSCDNKITLLSRLEAKNGAIFNYTGVNFIEYSFVDLYNDNLTESMLKDRIVLVGVKTSDVKNEISDNFIDPFGNVISGIEIHANVLNTFLNQKFQRVPTFEELFLYYIVASLLITFIGYHILKKFTSRSLFYFATFVLNLIIGVLLYEFGVNWPFIGTSLLLLFLFILMIAYDAMMHSSENKIIKKAFKYYVNPDLLKKLMIEPGGLNLGGEERYMTVLFSDIRGFTALAEKMEPKQIYSLLNRYLEGMSGIILDNAGTIDKYIGDGIMAFWNAPVNVQFHQENAVKAALEMVAKLEDFNKSMDVPMKIGIGIHTGSMLVGNVGGSARFDYTVLGDSVNVASRLEGLTKLYKVSTLVSQALIESLNKDWEGIIFRKIDVVGVVGRSESLVIYQPLDNNTFNIGFKESYENALNYYIKGEFDKAKKIFELYPNDYPSQLMLKRINDIGTPPDNWTGVWEWKDKK